MTPNPNPSPELRTEASAGDMAYACASDAACICYPGLSQLPERAAFCAGAAFHADGSLPALSPQALPAPHERLVVGCNAIQAKRYAMQCPECGYGGGGHGADCSRAPVAALGVREPVPQALPAPGEVERNLEAQRQAIEACARIADNHAEPTDTPDDFTQGYERAAGRIARSIRKLCPNASLATVAAANDEGVARSGLEIAAAWHDAESAKAADSEKAAQLVGSWDRMAYHQKMAAFHSSSAVAIRLLSQGEGGMNPQELLALADRVEAIRSGFDNAIDVQCEIALFEPDDCELAIRANAAGSKVIVTINGGPDRTFIARDFTISAGARRNTAARLRELATSRSQHEGASS